MKYIQKQILEMFVAISTEPQFRHRLDSFLPDQPEGDTISEIVRFRNEQEEEQKKKSRIPRWIRRLKFPHVIEPQSMSVCLLDNHTNIRTIRTKFYSFYLLQQTGSSAPR